MTALESHSVLMLVVAILSFLPVSQSIPPWIPANQTIDYPTLARRECTPRPSAPGQFDCDFEMPTLSQFMSHMVDPEYGGRVNADTVAFFYSNLGTPKDAVFGALVWFARQNIWKHYSALSAMSPPAWYWAQHKWIVDHPDGMDLQNPRFWFNICYTEALATAAIHPDAYLFTKDDEEPYEWSIWVKVELPALTQNKNIKRVYRVDPRTPEQRRKDPEECSQSQPTLIWDRERGDAEITTTFKCPLR